MGYFMPKSVLAIIVSNYFFIIWRVKARAIPCTHQLPTRGDNTVSVAQGGTATPGATKQLLLLDRVFKRIKYPLRWQIMLYYIILYYIVECSPMVQETRVQSQVESYQRLKKWYLIPPCLTLGNIRYESSVKGSNPGKGVAPSPTLRCSSYWKGSLRIALANYTYLLYQLQWHVICFWISCLSNKSLSYKWVASILRLSCDAKYFSSLVQGLVIKH